MNCHARAITVLSLGLLVPGTMIPAQQQQPSAIVIGAPGAEGRLQAGDWVQKSNGVFVDRYRTEATAGQRFTVLVTSEQPVRVIVYNGADGSGMRQSPSGRDHRLEYTTRGAGAYRINVVAPAAGMTTSYRIRLVAAAGAGAETGTERAGQTAAATPAPAAPPPAAPQPGSGPVLARSDFDDGRLGPFANAWAADLDFPDDPTGSGRGRVARLTYHPRSGGSMERAVSYVHPTRLRYGETIWMRGDVYLPTPRTPGNPAHNRKLLDYQGGGVRMTLHRVGPNREVKFSYVDATSGVEREIFDDPTGIRLADNTWWTIEVRMTTNSADGVADGELEIYVNGRDTPAYTRRTGLRWITERFRGGSYFQRFHAGFQLTIDRGTPVYTEERYWDNLAYSRQRVRP